MKFENYCGVLYVCLNSIASKGPLVIYCIQISRKRDHGTGTFGANMDHYQRLRLRLRG
jgi:hypothetical protein